MTCEERHTLHRQVKIKRSGSREKTTHTGKETVRDGWRGKEEEEVVFIKFIDNKDRLFVFIFMNTNCELSSQQ